MPLQLMSPGRALQGGAWSEMVILSCQVMKDTHGGLKWWACWGPAFNGLHQMLGYRTNARANTNTTGVFAEWQLGYFFILPPMPVRTSWCLAKKQEQPNDRQAVIMGVVGPGGVLGGWNDHFWGQGPVGPDLRGNNITAYWRIVYQ